MLAGGLHRLATEWYVRETEEREIWRGWRNTKEESSELGGRTVRLRRLTRRVRDRVNFDYGRKGQSANEKGPGG